MTLRSKKNLYYINPEWFEWPPGGKRLEMVCGVSSAQTYLLAFSVTGWEKELFREDEMNELFVKKLPIQETTTIRN